MALFTMDQVASVGLELAKDSLGLTETVLRINSNDWKPGGGRSVLIPVPGAAVVRDRNLDTVTQIEIDKIVESSFAITLSVHALSAVSLTDAEETLDLAQFSRQILRPQIDALTDRAERAVAAALNGATLNTSIAWDAAAPLPTFTALRRALRDQGVNTAEATLFAAVGGSVADALLDSGVFDLEKSGNTDALVKGELGTLRGLRIVESDRIADDEIVAYHKDAVYLATKAPAVPNGHDGSKAKGLGIEYRNLLDYSADTTENRSVVDSFLAAGIMPAYRVTRVTTPGSEAATVSEISGGQVVRMSIGDTEPA